MQYSLFRIRTADTRLSRDTLRALDYRWPMPGQPNLESHPLHLGLGATATPQPEFTGEMSWYEGYGERHGGDGVEGRLVSQHTFTENWDVWEMHPLGAEVVLALSGTVRLHQEIAGATTSLELSAGEYAINPPGAWHTADVVEGPTTVLFITAGAGTEHRPR